MTEALVRSDEGLLSAASDARPPLGVSAEFQIDLVAIPCRLPANGASVDIALKTVVDGLQVTLTLVADSNAMYESPSRGFRGFYFGRAVARVTDPASEMDMAHPLLIGVAMGFRSRFQVAAIACLNRVISFFKFEFKAPGLRNLGLFDFVDQPSFWNPTWSTASGKVLLVSEAPLETSIGSSGHIAGLMEDLYGNKVFLDSHLELLRSAFALPVVEPSVSDQMFSHAVDSAFAGHFATAALQLAISVEVLVKNTFFGSDPVAGAAMGSLQDKGTRVKVLDLLGRVAADTFGQSFGDACKTASESVQEIFNCRNQIAHKGTPRFRKDEKWHDVDQATLKRWFASVRELSTWLGQAAANARSTIGVPPSAGPLASA